MMPAKHTSGFVSEITFPKAFIVFALVAVLLVAGSNPGCVKHGNRQQRIEQAIDKLTGTDLIKISMQPRIDAVVTFGEEAVPLLIERTTKTDDARCRPLVIALCQIGSPEALRFVRQIMKAHTKRYATAAAIEKYPVENESDIIDLLIDLLHGEVHQYISKERIKAMIERKPSRAGHLVESLRDEPDFRDFNLHAKEILAFVSGYSYTWDVRIPSGQDPVVFGNNFWRDWWKRNMGKNVFGWLEEPALSDNETRQVEALRRMSHLRDERAIPYFTAGLDSPSERVQHAAVVGLKALEGSLPESGYLLETYREEKADVIVHMKLKYTNED
ncbi:hypothetical protein JXA40_04525 [bacterium]|nr:hypothetical protein [candidate division CSSED10-310 bacterium]